MIIASSSDGNSRESQTKISRSMFRKRTRFRDLRLNTSNCWRRTRISASRAARASIAERRASRIRLSNANIALCSNTLVALRHADDILNRDRT